MRIISLSIVFWYHLLEDETHSFSINMAEPAPKRSRVGDDQDTVSHNGNGIPFEGENMSDTEEFDQMEEVVLNEAEEGFMENFIGKVKRMCQLEDEIKEINANRKVLADEKNELRAEIISFMSSKEVGKINYGNDEVIYIETRESAGSLNRKSLMTAIKEYYAINDVEVNEEQLVNLERQTQERIHDAQDLYDFVNEYLGTQTKVVLVREARDKKKRARKPAPLSVINSCLAKK